MYNGSELTGKAVGTTALIDDSVDLKQKYEIEKRRGYITDDNLLGHAYFSLTRNESISYDFEKVLGNNAQSISYDDMSNQIAERIESDVMRKEYLEFSDKNELMNKYELGNSEVHIDYRMTMPNGKISWIRSVFHMMRDPNEMDMLLFCYCYNINKSKMMESMMQFAVNDDYDLIGSVDLVTGEAYMIFSQNSYHDNGKEYVEQSYEESVIKFAENAIVADERAEYINRASLKNIKKQLSDKPSFEFNIQMMSNGQTRIKKVRYLKFDGDIDMCLFTQIDITLSIEKEQKKQQMLREALSEAEVANRSKTTFLSQMSHEIRTPMNAVIGMANLAYEEKDIAIKNEYIKKIDSSSHFLLGIINDILDMSRIESGKFELHNSWYFVTDILNSCINMLEPEMKKKNIKFIYPSFDRIGNVEFYVDSLRCQQIYMNLLNNALKFTPEGGTIEMKFKNVSHDDNISNDSITIRDTGYGMSEEFLKRIFNPFEQEENIYTNQVQGTGLGLVLVKKILDAMGGRIEVKSELGKGSEFTFTIPYKYRLSEHNIKSKSSDIRDNSRLSGLRILLADDHPLNREIASKLLEKQGVMVDEAFDSEDVLEKYLNAEDNYYDLILMDVRMPKMNGLEATKSIRITDKPDSQTIPIIAMTANAFDSDVQTSIDAGMNAHLSKPFKPEVLYEIIRMNVHS